MSKSKYWFKPKRIGWGISYPISWEGWLSLLIMIPICLFIATLNNLGNTSGLIIFLGELLIILFLFTYLFRNKVKGGLKWRSFKDYSD